MSLKSGSQNAAAKGNLGFLKVCHGSRRFVGGFHHLWLLWPKHRKVTSLTKAAPNEVKKYEEMRCCTPRQMYSNVTWHRSVARTAELGTDMAAAAVRDAGAPGRDRPAGPCPDLSDTSRCEQRHTARATGSFQGAPSFLLQDMSEVEVNSKRSNKN